MSDVANLNVHPSNLTNVVDVLEGDLATLRAENERLRAENERLRAALTEVEDRLESIEVHEDIHHRRDAHSGTRAREALVIARAALRGGT